MLPTDAGPTDVTSNPAMESLGRAGFWRSVLGRRRLYLVSPRYQLRVSLLAVAVVLVLLVLLNLSLYSASQASSDAAQRVAPELRDFFQSQDRVQLNLTVLGSLVFLIGVFLIGILESHKTAGAAYNIGSCLDKLRQGKYRVRLRLRRGDNLREIEDSFNKLAVGLLDQTRDEIEALEQLASNIEQLTASNPSRDLALEVHRMVQQKRRFLE